MASEDDSKKPAATVEQLYYAVRKCDALEAPAIFMSREDCELFLDQYENDVTVESKSCRDIQEAVAFIHAPAAGNAEANHLKRTAPSRADVPPAAKRPKWVPQAPSLVPQIHQQYQQRQRPMHLQQLLPPLYESPVSKAVSKREQKFNENMKLLVEYKELHNTIDIPVKHWSIRNNKFRKLDQFILEARKHIMLFQENPGFSAYSEEQVQTLMDMGFALKPTRARSEGKVARNRDVRFEENIKLLEEYNQEYGTCDIPLRHESIRGNKYEKLARWIVETRKQVKLFEEDPTKSDVNEEQVKRLLEAGFVMQPTRGQTEKRMKAMESTWDEMIGQLKAFHKKNGHTDVPDLPKTELRNWVVRVREEFARMKEGANTALTAERIAHLSSLGFDLSTRRRQKFEERAYAWLEFKTKHGREPRRDTEEEPLALWVAKTRRKYRTLKQGGKANLTQEQIDLLTKWNFTWDIDTKYIPAEKPEYKTWEARFKDLLAYKEEHGNCLVPQSHRELGQWVKRQRKGKLRMIWSAVLELVICVLMKLVLCPSRPNALAQNTRTFAATTRVG